MAPNDSTAPESAALRTFRQQHARLIDRLHAESGCARWRLSPEQFAEALHRSADKHFRAARPAAAVVEEYLAALHLEDLALACACAAGSEPAWEFFVAHFRPELRAAARAIMAGPGNRDVLSSEDLADSLYAELWGVGPTGQSRRRSLFEYFHGRSKLGTWLHSVLAQRYVDGLRAGQRTVSLDAEVDGGPAHLHSQKISGPVPAPSDPDRARYLAHFDAALTTALAGLPPRERMLLAFFYLDRLTLAEIGRTLGEHESTVSRQLDRSRRGLRERVTELLRAELDPSQIQLAFEYALEDWPFDLSRALSKGGAAGAGSKAEERT